MSNFKDNIEVHVPTTVMQRQYSDTQELNLHLLNIITDLENRYKDTDQNEVNSQRVSTMGGYQTPVKVNFLDLDNKHIQNFRKKLSCLLSKPIYNITLEKRPRKLIRFLRDGQIYYTKGIGKRLTVTHLMAPLPVDVAM